MDNNNFTDRQLQIIKTANKMISKNGVKCLTFKKLAQELNVTEPSIYRHFSSKKEFLMILARYPKMVLGKKMDEIMEQDITPVEKLKQMLDFTLKYRKNQRGARFPLLGYAVSANDPEMLTAIAEVPDMYREKVKKVLDEGIKEKYIRKDIDTDLIAGLFIGFTQSTMLRHVFSLRRYKVEGHNRKIMDMLLNGISKNK